MSEMIVQVDTREKENDEIISYFTFVGQPWFSSKVPSGDYINFKAPKVVIDVKKNLEEVANNVTTGHNRFVREILTAKNDMRCQFVVLIREPYNSIEDIKKWKGKHTNLKGETLYKIMCSMKRKYNIYWRFCSREQSGAKVLAILQWFDENFK